MRSTLPYWEINLTFTRYLIVLGSLRSGMQTRRSRKVYTPPGLVPSVVLGMRCTAQTVWGTSRRANGTRFWLFAPMSNFRIIFLDTRIWITYYCPALPTLRSNPSPSHMTLPASGERTSPREPIIPPSPTLCTFHRRFRCSLLSLNSISRLTSRSVTVHFRSITLQVLGELMAKALNGTGQCLME